MNFETRNNFQNSKTFKYSEFRKLEFVSHFGFRTSVFFKIMRKKVFGRQFKRDKGERKALFSGLISQLIVKGRIETTEAKAKSVKGQIEKLVTAAKN